MATAVSRLRFSFERETSAMLQSMQQRRDSGKAHQVTTMCTRLHCVYSALALLQSTLLALLQSTPHRLDVDQKSHYCREAATKIKHRCEHKQGTPILNICDTDKIDNITTH